MKPPVPVAQRFPLLARPRPTCTPLPGRIDILVDLAQASKENNDLAGAARVLNQAALIASDCNQPDLARTWCHRHALAWLREPHSLSKTNARQGLEPLVNLARLKTRAGDGATAHRLITQLFEAIRTRADTVIDSISVPAGALTTDNAMHRELTRWLYGVCLADGTRALISAGHWKKATSFLHEHNGVGQRMLDGRQVAIIALLLADRHQTAQQLLASTMPGEPWEAAVTTCLEAWCKPEHQPPTASEYDHMINTYQQLSPAPELVVFHTHLGLSIADATTGADHPNTDCLEQSLIDSALLANDGYAARALLNHPITTRMSAPQRTTLVATLETSGLGRPMNQPECTALEAAVSTSEYVIRGPRTNTRKSR